MKKIQLGGVATAPSSAKPKHQSVTVSDGEFQTLLDQWARLKPQLKTLEAQSKALGGQLGPRIKALYFSTFAGRTPESSTMLVTAGGREIKLITKNQYGKDLTDEEKLKAAIGEENVATYFHQSTVLELDLNKAAEDKQEEFANAVVKLAETMGVMAAVSAKQCIQPKAGFHEARTSILTPEENVALDKLMPVVAFPML